MMGVFSIISILEVCCIVQEDVQACLYNEERNLSMLPNAIYMHMHHGTQVHYYRLPSPERELYAH